MEYCGCGSITDLIKLNKQENRSLTENEIAAITIDILKGLAYLHKSKTIHRDLKPANILLNSSGEAKLADFGVSAQLTTTLKKAQTTIGTPLYMSPQVIDGSDYDFKADIWSLGITLIEMIQGELPYVGMNIMKAISDIVNGDPPTLSNPSKYSSELNSFLSECLTKNPEQRKNASELLAHPFILNRLGNDNRKIMKDMLKNYYPDLFQEDIKKEREKLKTVSKEPENFRQSTELKKDESLTAQKKDHKSITNSPSPQTKSEAVDYLKMVSDLQRELDTEKKKNGFLSTENEKLKKEIAELKSQLTKKN